MRKIGFLKGYTFIEVLVSITILSSLFLLLMQVILSLYKSNQYITTLNAVTIQDAQIEHILKKMLISADPKSIDCSPNLTDEDMNGDGHIDKKLVEFKTIYNQTRYLLVEELNAQVPYKLNETYNRLALYKYNDSSHSYEKFITLTDPVVDINNLTVNCTPLPAVEDKLQNVWFTTITLNMTFDSIQTYLFIPGLMNTKIVTNYPFFMSTLIIN